MSDFEDASLILTPNAYKAGKAYCVKPFDGSGDLTVVRNTTATRRNENGLIEVVGANVPRLNYPVGGGCPSWLVEPQRTNLFLNSNTIGSSGWSINGADSNITLNDTNSPNGLIEGSKIEATTTSVVQRFVVKSPNLTVSIGQQFTQSYYLKAGTYDKVAIVHTVNGLGTTYVDLTNKTIVSNSAGTTSKIIIEDNGWVRVEQTTPIELTGANRVFGVYFSNNTFTSITASQVIGNNFYIWGAQLEQGGLTSYIPTTTSAVTRNADVFSKANVANLIGQTEGTVFLEIAFNDNDLSSRYITFSDNTNSKRIIIASYGVSNGIRCQMVNGTNQAEIFHQVNDITEFNKIAFKYKENDFSMWVNGVEVGSDNSGTVASGLNTILFANPGNIIPFKGSCKNLTLFKTALSDTQLQQLTTI